MTASDRTSPLSPSDELELLRRREAEHERKLSAEMNRRIRADYRRAKGGADPWPSVEAIIAKRRELEDAGRASGHRSIAKALGYSESTIRRRLGKIK